MFCYLSEAAKRLADGGRIINFSSTTTCLLLPTYGSYVATKGAVEQLTRVLAKELGARKITVNVVSPGPVNTELFVTGKSAEQLKQAASLAALGASGSRRIFPTSCSSSPATRWAGSPAKTSAPTAAWRKGLAVRSAGSGALNRSLRRVRFNPPYESAGGRGIFSRVSRSATLQPKDRHATHRFPNPLPPRKAG